MNLFNQIFNRNKSRNNAPLKKEKPCTADVTREKYTNNYQAVIAHEIKDTTILQIFEGHRYIGPLIDEKINEELEFIRKSRFFSEYNTFSAALTLAKRLTEGDLSSGRSDIRCNALAWCARLLSSEKLGEAEEIFKITKTFGGSIETSIAEAFLYSNKGRKDEALQVLVNIDLPISRTASLMIVANNEGPKQGIEWLKTARISATDLDSDGKYFLITLHIQLADWDAALEHINLLQNNDLKETPILNHISAIIQLIRTVPNEFRSIVFNQVPFNAASFPLAADANALEARKRAHDQFVIASEVALKLEKPIAAAINDEYALWLELMDTNELINAKKKLEDKLRNSTPILRYVRLGLTFNVKLDVNAVEREIERQIALNGVITYDTAIARFALAFAWENPEDIANYIAKHQEELSKYFDRRTLQYLHIEMLAQAGLIKKAKDCLDVLISEGLPEEEGGRLSRIIVDIENTNPIELRKEQFNKTNSLSDLMSLVDELRARGEWDELCIFGKLLFERTHSLGNAGILAEALSNSHNDEQLVEFLKANTTFIDQSKNLHMLYCWALYNVGDLIEARGELTKLYDEKDNPNYLKLQINLGITLGDWNNLNVLIANEYQNKDIRSAVELIQTATLAFHLGSPYTKELTFAAARKGNDDVNILVAAYSLASSAGWEDNSEVSKWISKAAEISTEDGPIQKLTLKDLFSLKPDWDKKETEVWQQLSRGDIPLFIAAQLLNRSLVHMMLFPSLANLSESDPRRRGVVPAYSGNRHTGNIKAGGVVAIDATALLSLGFLNLIDKALDAFDKVYIPHSTLRWLFEEKHKAAFHQPSRFKDAHQIEHLLATGALQKLKQSSRPNSELVDQVGIELAQLLTEAENVSSDGVQRLVIRPYPVHRVASLMEEEADLTTYSKFLCSCQAVVDKLKQKGQLTADEVKKANAYLLLHEKPWPNQPEITDKAILYIDDLALYYFQNIGILEKLKTSGFVSIISTRKVNEINELISYEENSGKINEVIERIRISINTRILSGKVKIGKRFVTDESKSEARMFSDHPTFEIFAISKYCEAVIVDDRCINQNSLLDNGSTKTLVFSTQDIIFMLASIGSITVDEQLEYRTTLRRAGYCFIPISVDELTHYLSASTLNDSCVSETAELKAIRENILQVRMWNWLQLPKEILWLDGMIKTFIGAMHEIWRCNPDFPHNRAISDWIMNQINVRGWARFLAGPASANFIKTGWGAYILLLLSPTHNLPAEISVEYMNWVEDAILLPIREQNPEFYSWIINWYKDELVNLTNRDN